MQCSDALVVEPEIPTSFKQGDEQAYKQGNKADIVVRIQQRLSQGHE